MNIIYLSYDGMTDPLGQSQVLPYIGGLSKKGCHFTLVSCEKKEQYIINRSIIEDICTKNNIDWQPIFYTKNPPVLSTLLDIYKLDKKVKQLYKHNHFSLIHCRSYITALIGLSYKRKYSIPFLFDMRGFWADERIDGNIWNIHKLHYKWIFNFFKKKEKEFLTQADHTISLTHSGKSEIKNWNLANIAPIDVIPCCTDNQLFDKENINQARVNKLKSDLNIKEKDNVISYLGSTGTWYMLDEMLDFFAIFFAKNFNNKALFITQDNSRHILKIASTKGIDLSKIIIVSSKRIDVPSYLSICNASVFFIKPLFSKKASSATKMGEIMSLGIPVICNAIGDNNAIVSDVSPELLVKEFSSNEYGRVLDDIETLDNDIFREKISNKAAKYFSLENGVDKYYNIYKTIAVV